jgi:hypothetical protein
MWRTHGTLHLDKLNFVHLKIMDVPTAFMCIIVFFDRFLIWLYFEILRSREYTVYILKTDVKF